MSTPLLTAELAGEFRAECRASLLFALRFGTLVPFAGFLAFAGVDPFAAHSEYSLLQVLLARALIMAALAAIMAVSFSRAGPRLTPLLSVTLVLVVGWGIVALTCLTGGAQSRYQYALHLLFLGTSLILPLTPRVVAASFSAVLLGYDLAIWTTTRVDSVDGWIIDNAIFWAAAAISSASAVRSTRLREEEFVHRTHLRRANEGLRELDTAKNQFFTNVSHELRTPLTLVIAAVESLRETMVGAGKPAPHQIETCRRNSVRLLRQVDDLLELSRLESASTRLKIREFDLRAMVAELVAQIRPLAARKDLTVDADFADDAAMPLQADEGQIERVWLSLAGNALKFTPAGGRIVLGARVDAAGYRGWIEDTGEGIPPDALEKIFERFYQVEATRAPRRAGVGIGLSLVRRIVELHQGRAWAESEPGRGARISFWLPRTAGAVAEAQTERRGEEVLAPAERRRGQGLAEWDGLLRGQDDYRLSDIEDVTDRRSVERSGQGGRGLSVLLVDDNPDILDLLAGVLGDEYRIQTAPDGRAALDEVRRAHPDLIISDVMMPHMTGLELLVALRADRETQGIPVVLLTARGQAEDRISASEGGADAYLSKPFHPQELRTVLRNILRKQEAQAAAVIDERSLALRVMAEGIAHDVLNPLGFVRGALLILSRLVGEAAGLLGPEHPRGAAIGRDGQEFFRSGDEGIQRAIAAIGELRRFSRGDTTSQVARIDVNDAVRRVVTVAATQGRVDTALGAREPVAMRVGQLEQVLLNLVINAQQAAGTGSQVLLTTWDEPAASAVKISVRDNGPGMDRATLQRVFDPYFTTKQMGTGLGLTVSRQIIRDGGGTLGVESQAGQGTTFTISLPASATR